ncbi:MAG TPA: SIMPL domain-containing protein [Stellaceae bacterium]
MRFAILAFSAALLPALAQAQTVAPPPKRDENGTVLHLTERSERMVKRDRLTADLRVEASDADPARLQAEINRRMAAALDHAKSVAAVTVATGGYSVYQQQASPQAPARWHGMQSLLLASRDAAPLLPLAGALQQQGLALYSLGYELTPEAARSVEDELTSQALSRLRERAERIAGALGMTVERLRDVQVGNADGTPPMPHPMQYKAMAAASPVAEPGDAAVSVSVSAEVLLAPRR